MDRTAEDDKSSCRDQQSSRLNSHFVEGATSAQALAPFHEDTAAHHIVSPSLERDLAERDRRDRGRRPRARTTEAKATEPQAQRVS